MKHCLKLFLSGAVFGIGMVAALDASVIGFFLMPIGLLLAFLVCLKEEG